MKTPSRVTARCSSQCPLEPAHSAESRVAAVLSGCDAEFALRVDRRASRQHLQLNSRAHGAQKKASRNPTCLPLEVGEGQLSGLGSPQFSIDLCTRVQGRKRRSHKILYVLLAVRIIHLRRGSSAIALTSLLFPPKLGKKVAACQLKESICRIFFDQRTNHFKGPCILLVVVMEIDCEIKTRLWRNQNALFNRVLQLPNAISLVPAGNAHKKPQNARCRRKRIDVVVI